MSAVIPAGARLLSCREVARIYRKSKATPLADWRSGKLPGKRRGKTIWVSAKRAEEIYGVGA